MAKIKLFISDIDGTLTDGSVYYSDKGEALKKFSYYDGLGFRILKQNYDCITCLITSSFDRINKARFNKFDKLKTVDLYFDGKYGLSKIDILWNLCRKYNIHTSEIAYIGDDINDQECLESVGFPACPFNAIAIIKRINNIYVTNSFGGNGAVREFIDLLIEKELLILKFMDRK